MIDYSRNEPPTVEVKVKLLRRAGVRVKAGDREAEREFLGTISSFYSANDHVCTLATGQPADAERRLPPPLHRVTIEQMAGRRIRLMGFELVGGHGYVQEWIVEFL